jgi:hypothetical protein
MTGEITKDPGWQFLRQSPEQVCISRCFLLKLEEIRNFKGQRTDMQKISWNLDNFKIEAGFEP